MTSLLYYTGRIAKWCTVLGASDIMCMPRTPLKGQILENLVAESAGPPLEKGQSHEAIQGGSAARLVLKGIY